MTKYDKLDEMIQQKLRVSPGLTFVSLMTGDIRDECERLAQLSAGDPLDIFRVIDRRLQALRKRYVIIFKHGKGWSLA